jgi:hypothetical protein
MFCLLVTLFSFRGVVFLRNQLKRVQSTKFMLRTISLGLIVICFN